MAKKENGNNNGRLKRREYEKEIGQLQAELCKLQDWIKYWMEVDKKEQQSRFEARIKDPLRQWKLSPMDLESFRRWYEYSRARDQMLEATDSKHAPWYIVRSDDKKKARLNCITHLLGM